VTARSRFLPYLLLGLLALALFVPGEASLPPLDRDEARYMQATTQMFETGNFIDIRFQDQPRYLQPAGIYWLQALSVSLLSAPEKREVWAYRVPSLVGATLAVLLTAWIGNLLFGAPTGFVAAVLLAVSLILGVEARIAKIDAVQLAVVLAAQTVLARIYLQSREAGTGREKRTGWAAAGFWLALGLGMMLKGPIILLVVLGTILMLAITERRVGWLRQLRPVWGVPLMLAVVLPWLVAIGVISKGAFLADAVGHSMLGKVATGQQSHGAPPGYYLAAFPLTFWPGSLFAAFAAAFVWARRREPAVRFCLCWIVPTWIVFELILTKLPHYTLPTYPAIACLAAAGLLAPGGRGWPRWGVYLVRAFAAVWLIVGVALACLPPVATWALEARIDPVGVLTALTVFPLLVVTLVLLRRGRSIGAVGCAGAAALVLYVSAYAYQLPNLQTVWMSPRIADAVARAKPCPTTTLATVPYREPSLVFLLGTGTKLTDVKGAAEHLLRDPACGLALVGAQERGPFLSLMQAAKVEPREVERISGLNYSTGKKVELFLYAARPAG
jgi:4-amino-4-deoxy-L-arabinose transferase-like glycosyltransferase